MIDPLYLLAIALALAAAIGNASNQLFVRIGTDEGLAYNAVFVVMLTNLVVLVPAVAVLYYPDYGLTRISWFSFIAAGVFGTMLGRMFFYSSIQRIGASRSAPIVAGNAIVGSLLAVLLLGEALTWVRAAGIVLVVVGVATLSWETTQENPDNLPRRTLLLGMVLPFGAALAYGIEPIFAITGFNEGTPAPVGLAVKTVAATLGFMVYLRWRGALPTVTALTSRNTRWFVLAGIGNTVFLIGYYVSLSLAPVSVVLPIVITHTLFVVVLSAIFMPQRLERITWRLVVAAIVVVGGVLLVTIPV